MNSMNKVELTRRLKGYTMEGVAEKAGMSTMVVFAAEKGIPIKKDSAKRLARVLKIPLKEILISTKKIGRPFANEIHRSGRSDNGPGKNHK